MRQLDFNTLDKLVASDQWQALAEQAKSSIKAMQTEVPQFGIQPHVVLPVFQDKEQEQGVQEDDKPGSPDLINGSGKGQGYAFLKLVKRKHEEKAQDIQARDHPLPDLWQRKDVPDPERSIAYRRAQQQKQDNGENVSADSQNNHLNANKSEA